ncbi:penicillin-binding protein 1A [Sulfurimonas sp.]|uniref:penicillin-binding protein 1A n=1 Tax=Sulfurimonas sp. TaxID=2022749 RepID=UPI0025E54349|nr:PBP1A family penicillin-binding protein [Sulfurimonas sp.]MDD5157521.1 PBP1A family penicillin-binding protein [Sulfurimonas sp.]
MKKRTKVILSILAVGISVPFLVLLYYLKQDDYDISRIITYNPAVSSRIYDKNGEKIANLFEEKHRYYAPFSEIPPAVIEALLAVEDTTFFEHQGVNLDAIFRALIKDVSAGKMVEGASTITQQLVKNRVLTRDKKLSRKIKEAIFSMKVELSLTKEEILERYLNEIYFGHGYYGIKTAADGYFHKKLKELTSKEIAILVGLPKSPNTYMPTKNYEISMGRANRVLDRLHALGWIEEDDYSKSLTENPKVYDESLGQNGAPFIVDEVIRRAKELGIDDIRTGGYEIYTTIDMRLQEAAVESLQKAYKASLDRIGGYKKGTIADVGDEESQGGTLNANASQLNGAMISLDSRSGDILALVGSVDYRKSSFNRITQGVRQAGSAFKPFIYQVALDLGYSGASEVADIARTYTYMQNGKEVLWQPKNYEKGFKGIVTLRDALVHSRNLATISLVEEIGFRDMQNEIKKFNMQNIPKDLSFSLGSITLSPLQLAKYYTSFANSGVQMEPNLIKNIKREGKLLFEKKEKSRQITTPSQAYLMTTILKDVVEKGTATNARVPGIDLAGKTGTTNNNVDAWFAGYSPTIETIVWFGNDDNSPMHRSETGGRISAPAFAMYYQSLLKLYPQTQRKFDVPSGVSEMMFNGTREYFTDVSKPPHKDSEVTTEEKLLF